MLRPSDKATIFSLPMALQISSLLLKCPSAQKGKNIVFERPRGTICCPKRPRGTECRPQAPRGSKCRSKAPRRYRTLASHVTVHCLESHMHNDAHNLFFKKMFSTDNNHSIPIRL